MCNTLMTLPLLPTRRPTYRTPLMLFLKHILLGLTGNVTKIKVIFQPAQPIAAKAPNTDIEGTTLENVDHFAYLGSYFSKPANIDVEIQHRIRCPCVSYGRLKDRVISEKEASEPQPRYWPARLLFSPPSYMAVRHGSPTVAMLKCSNSSNSAYSELSSVSIARSDNQRTHPQTGKHN